METKTVFINFIPAGHFNLDVSRDRLVFGANLVWSVEELQRKKVLNLDSAGPGLSGGLDQTSRKTLQNLGGFWCKNC